MKKIGLVSDTITREDIDSLIMWLQQEPIPRLTKGDLTLELEAKWARMVGTKYSVFVNSGSSALLLMLVSLLQLERKKKKIIVSGLSWATDVSTPMLLGYDVTLCDCNLTDLSCDLIDLKRLFDRDRPDYLLLVSPLGLVPDMIEVMNLCKEYGVILLEDVCESMGSRYRGKMLGSFGIASVFSTYYGHHCSSIEGGFVNTDDPDLYDVLVAMRSHGWDRDLRPVTKERLRTEARVDEFKSLYTFHYPGLNLRSTDLQAHIGLRAIDRLANYVTIREANLRRYVEKVRINEIEIRMRSEDITSSFAYPVVSRNRNRIVAALTERGVECRPLIAGSMGRQPFYTKVYGVKPLRNGDTVDRYGFYVPNHHDITDADVDEVSRIINENS